MRKCTVIMDDIRFVITLRKTLTANIIYDAMPIIGAAHKWGKEYYFHTEIKANIEKGSKSVINKGEIAYWPNGNAIAIGYGKTPISISNEIRLADNCNIWADTEFNLDLLDKLNNLKIIKIQKLDT